MGTECWQHRVQTELYVKAQVIVHQELRFKVIVCLKHFQEKPISFRYIQPVPQTDTGSRGENPKVLKRFMAKELGKIDP